jgi:hypothetical protein
MPALSSKRLERTELPEALQPQLRLYRRLYIARIDLEEARVTAEDLLARRIAVPRSRPPSALLMAMNTALVVSYARPFVHSRGDSKVAEKAVPGILLRSLTAREREMHEELITMRNKEVAHSDADILEMSFDVFKDGDGAIFKSTREPFRRPVLRSILKLVVKLEDALQRRCEELRMELPHNVWI